MGGRDGAGVGEMELGGWERWSQGTGEGAGVVEMVLRWGDWVGTWGVKWGWDEEMEMGCAVWRWGWGQGWEMRGGKMGREDGV